MNVIILRSLTVWLILIAAEILHGIVRAIFRVSHVGQFRSNQIGVVTGSLIIVTIALVFVVDRCFPDPRGCWDRRPVGRPDPGLRDHFWAVRGRGVVGAAAFLMPLGMTVLVLSPWIAGKLRGAV